MPDHEIRLTPGPAVRLVLADRQQWVIPVRDGREEAALLDHARRHRATASPGPAAPVVTPAALRPTSRALHPIARQAIPRPAQVVVVVAFAFALVWQVQPDWLRWVLTGLLALSVIVTILRRRGGRRRLGL